jgi:hypothetical protein
MGIVSFWPYNLLLLLLVLQGMVQHTPDERPAFLHRTGEGAAANFRDMPFWLKMSTAKLLFCCGHTGAMIMILGLGSSRLNACACWTHVHA